MSAQKKDPDLESTEIEPSEYLRKRRHAAVNDLRERVYRARDRAYDALADGQPEALKNDMIRASVEHYITELEPLLVNTQQGQPYWSGGGDVYLGEVVILPPDDGREYNEDLGYEIPIEGLQDFQDSPKRFDADFTYEVEDMVRGVQLGSVTREVAMPEHVSWNAFRYANQFAYQIGLDIDHKQEVAVEAEPF